MNLKRYCCLLLLGLVGFTGLQASKKKKMHVDRPACGSDKQACEKRSNNCQCFCAFKPGPRNKTVDDTLIFVENDPAGNYCYCKQRDIDKLNDERRESGQPEIQA